MKRQMRLFTALFLALIALHLALVLSARLYPFTDLSDHLAAATIIRYTGEPSNQFAEYYRVDIFLKPNTFHVLFCSLAIFPSVEFANRVFSSLYVVLLPVSVLLAVKKLGGNEWFAFLSFLLVYNYNVSWGFAGFAFAEPLVVLFSLFFIFDERGVTGLPRIASAAAFLVFLYFVHLLAAIFCLLVLVLRLAARGRGSRRALAGVILASLPLAVLVTLWWRSETRDYTGPGVLSFLAHYYRTAYAGSLLDRRVVLIFDNYHLFDGAAGYAVALVFSLVIIVPAAVLSLARRAGSPRGRSSAALPLVAGALLSCLLLPNEIPQQSVLYERFSALLLLGLIIYGAARAPERLPRAAAAAFVAIALCHYTLWTNYVFDFNRENAGFDKAFLRPPAGGAKLAGLISDYTYRGRPIYIHFPSYYIVWEKGVATATLPDYRFGPVRRRVSPLELPRYLEWVGKRGHYDGRYRHVDYLLTRGPVSLADFSLVRTAGRWALFERRLSAPGAGAHPKNN